MMRGGTYPPLTRLGYRPGLDGIRALAVTTVVVSHLDGVSSDGLLGWGGVTVFFVLSGFLITRLLLEERQANGRVSLTRFWRRRAARLIPAAFLVAAVVAGVEHNPAGGLVAASYLANWASITGVGPAIAALDHYWSLAVEEQFYLVWPLVLPLVAWRPRPLIGLAVLATVWRVFQPDMSHALFGTDTRADALLIGAAAAMVRLPSVGRLPAIAAGTILVAMMLVPVALVPMVGIPIVIAASVVLIAYGLDWTPPRLVTRLGVVSYGLYLWHLPLLVWFGPIGVPLSIVAAEVMHRVWETPLRRRLGGRSVDRHRLVVGAEPVDREVVELARPVRAEAEHAVRP